MNDIETGKNKKILLFFCFTVNLIGHGNENCSNKHKSLFKFKVYMYICLRKRNIYIFTQKIRDTLCDIRYFEIELQYKYQIIFSHKKIYI